MKLYNPAYNRTHPQGPCQSHLSFWPATTVQVPPKNPCLAQHSNRLKRFCPVKWPLLRVWVSVSGSASSPSQRPQKCLLSRRKHTHKWSAKMQHDNQPFILTRISIWQMEKMSLHFFPFSPSFVPLLIVTSLLNIYFVSLFLTLHPQIQHSFLLVFSGSLSKAGVAKISLVSFPALSRQPRSNGWFAPLPPGSHLCLVQMIFPVICSKAWAKLYSGQVQAKCQGL